MDIILLSGHCMLAAERRIGETSLNETSSRSHQILRLVCTSNYKIVISHIRHLRFTFLINLWILYPFHRQLKVLLVNIKTREIQAFLQLQW